MLRPEGRCTTAIDPAQNAMEHEDDRKKIYRRHLEELYLYGIDDGLFESRVWVRCPSDMSRMSNRQCRPSKTREMKPARSALRRSLTKCARVWSSYPLGNKCPSNYVMAWPAGNRLPEQKRQTACAGSTSQPDFGLLTTTASRLSNCRGWGTQTLQPVVSDAKY